MESKFSSQIVNKKSNPQKINVELALIEYCEDDIFYVYCPALDLVGYGKSFDNARESWETVLNEYFSYTLNKGTLIEDLTMHGWCIKKNKKYSSPSISWMLQNNSELNEVYDNHNFRKVSTNIEMPYAFA